MSIDISIGGLFSPFKLPRFLLGKSRDISLALLPDTPPVALNIMPPYVGSPRKNYVLVDQRRKWALPIYLDPVLVSVCRRIAGGEDEKFPLPQEIQKFFLQSTSWNWRSLLCAYIGAQLAKTYSPEFLEATGGVWSIKLEDLTYLSIDES